MRIPLCVDEVIEVSGGEVSIIFWFGSFVISFPGESWSVSSFSFFSLFFVECSTFVGRVVSNVCWEQSVFDSVQKRVCVLFFWEGETASSLGVDVSWGSLISPWFEIEDFISWSFEYVDKVVLAGKHVALGTTSPFFLSSLTAKEQVLNKNKYWEKDNPTLKRITNLFSLVPHYLIRFVLENRYSFVS